MLTMTNAAIFTLLSGLHFYWMLGGNWGLAQALPTTESEGKRMLNPGPLACLGIALGLLGFACYNVSLGIGFMKDRPFWANKWVIWAIAGIFLLRAMGDFRYVGFFKKVKNTEFGKMDTKWYAPLCLYLGLSSAWIGWELLR
ncbi:MAG: DUF3995 domain-containing protein [Phycisphaerae bacterium]|nr:DUF3995 domain-containing protein [Saprospiraceae bacterium]